jgi:colanic acid biosynthesis glycosyl transferase WcaI
MRITLFNQFFWPDASATSQILTDAARFLAKGHEIAAICADSGATISNDDIDLETEISVIRVRSAGFSRSALGRVLSYVSYLAGSLYWGLKSKRADVYVTLTTPPVLPIIGSLLSTLRRANHVIWEMDVYPDIATDIHYLKPGGLLDRVIGAILDCSRRRANAIIVLGPEMRDRVIARGVPENRIFIVENWADGNEIRPMPFLEGPLVIHYSGNLGLAHETETIQETIKRLANHPDFRFVFTGGGPRRSSLETFCHSENISNVEFRPYCKLSELGESLAEGHLGLVTQLTQTLGSVVPSKIYGIMAAGRPLLYIGPDGSTPARHIRSFQCGWHIQPGDAKGLENLLLYLCKNRNLLSEFGSRARSAFEENFNRTTGISRVLMILEEHSRAAASAVTLVESVRGD